jgi:hypothetical protein
VKKSKCQDLAPCSRKPGDHRWANHSMTQFYALASLTPYPVPVSGYPAMDSCAYQGQHMTRVGYICACLLPASLKLADCQLLTPGLPNSGGPG